jgi:phage shock protein A
MGWWSNITSVVKGKNQEAQKKFRNANMDTIMDQNVRDQKAKIVEIKKSIASVKTQIKMQEQQKDKHEGEAKRWVGEARRAAKAGREDLVASCIEKKNAAEANLAPIVATLDQYKKQEKVLEANLKKLEKTVTDNERQATVLKARKKTAEAMNEANKALSGLEGDGAFASFNEFEEEVNKMEAEGQAFGDMVDSSEMDLEDELASLGSANADDEVAAMMAKYNK